MSNTEYDVTQYIIIPYIECNNMIIDNYNEDILIVQKLADIIAIMEHLKMLEESRMVDC